MSKFIHPSHFMGVIPGTIQSYMCVTCHACMCHMDASLELPCPRAWSSKKRGKTNGRDQNPSDA